MGLTAQQKREIRERVRLARQGIDAAERIMGKQAVKSGRVILEEKRHKDTRKPCSPGIPAETKAEIAVSVRRALKPPLVPKKEVKPQRSYQCSTSKRMSVSEAARQIAMILTGNDNHPGLEEMQ